MSALAVLVCMGCQLCLVGGQILLKRGMNAADAKPTPWRAVLSWASGGVFLLSLWFFLWLGLLRDWQLTRLFPFEALSPLLLALAAWIFLRERLSRNAWIGVILIGIGVTLVAGG